MDIQWGIQDFINSLEEGKGRTLVRSFLFATLLCALYALYAHAQFRGLSNPQAMDYAQLGRNLAEGHGFTTQSIRPIDPWFLSSHHKPQPTDRQPELRSPPLFPALLAAPFAVFHKKLQFPPRARILPAETNLILPVCLLFTLASAILLFLLGRKLFDTQTAFIATAVFLLSEPALNYFAQGLPYPVVLFFALSAFHLITIAADRLRNPSFAPILPMILLAAAATAAAFLTAYSAIVLLPAILIFMAAQLEEKRGPAILTFCLAFALFIAPWIARNFETSGTPFGLAPYECLANSSLFPGDSLDQSLAPDIHNVAVARTLRTRLFSTFPTLLSQRLFTFTGGLLAALFFLALFRNFQSPAGERLKWTTLAGMALSLLWTSVTGPGPMDALDYLLPFVALIATAVFLDTFVRREAVEPWNEAVSIALFMLLSAIGAFAGIVGPPRNPPYPPCFGPFVAALAQRTATHDTVCTDLPEATAWYGNRTALLLPQTLEDFLTLAASNRPPAALYLTQATEQPAWLDIRAGRVPTQFPLTHALFIPPGTRDQIFLTAQPPQPESAEPEK